MIANKDHAIVTRREDGKFILDIGVPGAVVIDAATMRKLAVEAEAWRGRLMCEGFTGALVSLCQEIDKLDSEKVIDRTALIKRVMDSYNG